MTPTEHTDDRTEVIPSARRLINSLKHIGYDFSTAVADLIDNSLEANATKVDINVSFQGEETYVQIADNGKGMNNAELKEAMRFGSGHDNEREENLGKFGLGLKTASISQCRTFIVTSRSERDARNINAYCWDLDEVERTDRWEIIRIDPRTLNTLFNFRLSNATGTVVIWKKLNSITSIKNPNGQAAQTRVALMCRELEEHLSMVFHRFLSDEIPGRNLKITLNGNKIQAWDPYCRSEALTQKFDSIAFDFESNGKIGKITLQPYVLPPQEQFSSAAAASLASGPKKWNRQQGLYVYRSNRMIQSGGWAGIKTIDEHLKLARISLDFSTFLDEEFGLNISKMRVTFPSEVKEKINTKLGEVVKKANLTYRKKDPSPPPSEQLPEKPKQEFGPPIPKVPPSHIPETKPTSPSETIKLTFDEISTYLLCLANPEEKEVVERLLLKLANELRIQT